MSKKYGNLKIVHSFTLHLILDGVSTVRLKKNKNGSKTIKKQRLIQKTNGYHCK